MLALRTGLSFSPVATASSCVSSERTVRSIQLIVLHRSRELLRETKLPVYEVASWVGYESDLAFTKTFKKYAGTTSTRIRKNQAEAEAAVAKTRQANLSRQQFTRDATDWPACQFCAGSHFVESPKHFVRFIFIVRTFFTALLSHPPVK